jgi:hypothetical protein
MEDISNELFPPEGDEQLAEKVFGILEEIIKDKVSLGLHKKWNRNYELVRGKHWRNTSSIPLTKANLVYRHINQTVNQLTDNNPTFNISKSGDPNVTAQDVYDNLQRAATHWWVDQEQQDVLESSVYGGETYGIVIEKVIFNAELENGIGEAETIEVDPFHFGVYPVKMKNPRHIQKADANFHYYPMSVREAKRRWPKFADKIKADSDVLKELEDERRNINAETGQKPKSMMISLASVAKEILNWKSDTTSEGAELLIVEAWVHDYTKVTRTEQRVVESITDPETGEELVIEEETVEFEEPKYPGGIRYIVCCNGKVTLEDRKNPNINFDILPEEEARKTYLFDKFPFCAVNSVKDTSSMWGCSDIEQLEEIVMEFNKALSQLVLEKDRAVRRKYINPKNSGIPNDHFTNFVSILNPINEKVGAGVRVLDYPAIPVDVQNAITLFKDMFFLISATFEVDQAQLGSNQLAYKSIAALIERVATMMRGKIRAYGRLVRERGRMYLSHVQNFYTEDRWINYEDENGIQTSGVINGTKMIVPAKLTVVTGSTLPTSKVQQREESLALFQMQAIDRQELLSSLEWSGRADVIKRMNQGPIGAVMENLAQIGVPQDMLQFLSQVGTMDPKDLKKAIEKGEVPPFQAIIQQLLAAEQQRQGIPQPAAPVDPVVQAEIDVKVAEAAKKRAEAAEIEAEISKIRSEEALIIEKINTEVVDQQVKKEGVQFDKEKIRMDKARTVSEILTSHRESKERPKVSGTTPGDTTTSAPTPKPVPDLTAKPAGFNESGISSDNVEE